MDRKHDNWKEWKPVLRNGLFLLLAFLALIFLYPPSDNPIDYAELLKPVESSAIDSVGHSITGNVLVIKFKEGQYLYAYYDVPRSEYRNMIKSDSIGRYFNENIEGNYEVKKGLW